MAATKRIKKATLQAEVLPPALPAGVAKQIATPSDVDRFNNVLARLASGATLKEATEPEGISANSFVMRMGHSPELMRELTAAREGHRELGLLMAMMEAVRRLSDNPEGLTTRDLTDVVRAFKPFDKEGATRLEIVVE